MPITTLSSRAFNQNRSQLKKAVQAGPVIITDRGEPAMVMLSIEEYRRMSAAQPNIIDLLAMPGSEAFELEIPSRTEYPRAADLS